MVTELPFIEENGIRIFSKDVVEQDLKWHWDEEDRYITPMKPTDWMLQMDNELPELLNGTKFIPKGTFHRLIKGHDDLILGVIKR